MLVGKHERDANEEPWKVGDMIIEETDRYRYLGDVITNDGKNTENIKTRKTKIQATATNVKAMAGSHVLNRIGTSVLLELHDKTIIPCLLNNAETWNLKKSEEEELERIEVQTLKNLFDLPLHTPTAAILFSFGILHTSQKIEKKMLSFLHKILQRNDEDWTKKTLRRLQAENIGWFKKIQSILTKYDLPTDLSIIASYRPQDWKKRVKFVLENESRTRLQNDCYKKEDGNLTEKTKTKGIADKLKDNEYDRSPVPELLLTTRHETKTTMIARFRMLECGTNYKGTHNHICTACNVIDDEEHRLNHCSLWRDTNCYDDDEKINFESIYSNDVNVLRSIIPKIESVWNTRTAHGTMNK